MFLAQIQGPGTATADTNPASGQGEMSKMSFAQLERMAELEESNAKAKLMERINKARAAY